MKSATLPLRVEPPLPFEGKAEGLTLFVMRAKTRTEPSLRKTGATNGKDFEEWKDGKR